MIELQLYQILPRRSLPFFNSVEQAASGFMAGIFPQKNFAQQLRRRIEQIKILSWDRKAKGIDDALLRGISISEITPAKWLASLSDDCRNEVEQFLVNSTDLAHRFLN